MKRWLVVVSYRTGDGVGDFEVEFDEMPNLAEIDNFWPHKGSLNYILLTESRYQDVLMIGSERAAAWLFCCEYFGGPFDAIGHC